MLKDESCLQFSESRNNSGEQELRYAFYPNPYQFMEFRKEMKDIQELLDSQEITTLEYDQLVNEVEFTHDVPVIRYDYSPSQYDKYHHPASHFHIGFHTQNRWPVTKVLTPLTFFMKIMAMYYEKVWKSNFSLEVKSLNDLFSDSKAESYAVPSDYLGVEDYKRLTIS